MRKTSKNQTKSRIVSAAWQLFYRYGYDNTTIDDIVEASNTSKGSFYHYFESKDSLLGSLSYLFDEKYDELSETLDPSLSPLDKLIYMNRELFLMIENTVSTKVAPNPVRKPAKCPFDNDLCITKIAIGPKGIEAHMPIRKAFRISINISLQK